MKPEPKRHGMTRDRTPRVHKAYRMLADLAARIEARAEADRVSESALVHELLAYALDATEAEAK